MRMYLHLLSLEMEKNKKKEISIKEQKNNFPVTKAIMDCIKYNRKGIK